MLDARPRLSAWHTLTLDLIAIHDRTNTPETVEVLSLTTAATRLGQPADCAGSGLFPASKAASYVTGSTLAVNRGMRMD